MIPAVTHRTPFRPFPIDSRSPRGYHHAAVGGEMEASSTSGAQLQSSSQKVEAPQVGAVVLRVAWLAVLLGLAMQVLLIVVGVAFGKSGNVTRIFATTLSTISWSTVVCVGVAIGAVISKLDVGATSLAGLLSAPIAFNVARTVHRGVSTALHLSIAGAPGPSPLLLGIIKSLEYAALGGVVSWLAKRGKPGGGAYALVGLSVGAIFGGIALGCTYRSGVVTVADLVPRAVNELLFPVGCSMVLFVSQAVGAHLASKQSTR